MYYLLMKLSTSSKVTFGMTVSRVPLVLVEELKMKSTVNKRMSVISDVQ